MLSGRKEARIAQEVTAIFQLLEFVQSLQLLWCVGLVCLQLWLGFALVNFLKLKDYI